MSLRAYLGSHIGNLDPILARKVQTRGKRRWPHAYGVWTNCFERSPDLSPLGGHGYFWIRIKGWFLESLDHDYHRSFPTQGMNPFWASGYSVFTGAGRFLHKSSDPSSKLSS